MSDGGASELADTLFKQNQDWRYLLRPRWRSKDVIVRILLNFEGRKVGFCFLEWHAIQHAEIAWLCLSALNSTAALNVLFLLVEFLRLINAVLFCFEYLYFFMSLHLLEMSYNLKLATRYNDNNCTYSRSVHLLASVLSQIKSSCREKRLSATLNKRTELINKCRHRNKYKSKNCWHKANILLILRLLSRLCCFFWPIIISWRSGLFQFRTTDAFFSLRVLLLFYCLRHCFTWLSCGRLFYSNLRRFRAAQLLRSFGLRLKFQTFRF